MFRKKIESLRHSLRGIAAVWNDEGNFRFATWCALAAIIAGFTLGITPFEWLFVVVAIGMVLSLEIINTSVEELCDMVQPSHDPRVGRIKDISSAAVFSVSALALAIGCIIFIPRFMALL